MKVKELIEKLKEFPFDADIYIESSRESWYGEPAYIINIETISMVEKGHIIKELQLNEKETDAISITDKKNVLYGVVIE